MKSRSVDVLGRVAVMALASSAFAGPEWVETGDAGNVPGGAQVVSGPAGGLTKIKGTLAGLNGGAAGETDRHDMYLIQIDDPKNFLATTVTPFGGSANFDSNLWLFKVDGNGLLGNDDTVIIKLGDALGKGSSGSTLGPYATDQTEQTIPGPGLYLLAISGPYDRPFSAEGAIFNIQSSTEVSGPDGAGGGQPISFWQNVGLDGGKKLAGKNGDYEIFLEGVSSVPPQTLQLFLDIIPGACPNNFFYNSGGTIKVSLVGTKTFDVQDINVDSVFMVRTDGYGGQISPGSEQYIDNASPVGGGDACECMDLNGDGTIDLSMNFNKGIMKQAFLLSNSANGDFVSLTVCGFLNNGQAFTSHDCIKIIK